MDTMKAKPGAALNRDITSGERAEKDLDAFIARRDTARRRTEGERAGEAAWRESERRTEARRDAKLREEWACYHAEQAARHRANLEALTAYHTEQSRKYLPKGA